MKIKKIMKVLAAVVLAGCMAVTIPGMTLASTVGQAQDQSVVKYGALNKDERNLIYKLFDAEYYAQENPDVVAALGHDPEKLWTHFYKHGIFEGRCCNAGFNVTAYKSAYSDLWNAFGDDIATYYKHYLLYGIKEGRDLTTVSKAQEAGYTVTGFFGNNGVPAPKYVKPVIPEAPHQMSEAEIRADERKKIEEAAKAAVEEANKKGEDARIAEATEKAAKEAEQGGGTATPDPVPVAKDGYKIITTTNPVSMTINTYGWKNGNWDVVNTLELSVEYDSSGHKIAERYPSGSYYRKYEFDANGNLTKEMWNINNLYNGFDGYEYGYDSAGRKSFSKTWNQGNLVEWFEYVYETDNSNGLSKVGTINKVSFDPTTFAKSDVVRIGYCAFFYNERGDITQESFSDEKVYTWTYNADGTVRQRDTYIGQAFQELLQYSYNSDGRLVKETKWMPNNQQIAEEKIYTYGTTYVEVPQ